MTSHVSCSSQRPRPRPLLRRGQVRPQRRRVLADSGRRSLRQDPQLLPMGTVRPAPTGSYPSRTLSLPVLLRWSDPKILFALLKQTLATDFRLTSVITIQECLSRLLNSRTPNTGVGNPEREQNRAFRKKMSLVTQPLQVLFGRQELWYSTIPNSWKTITIFATEENLKKYILRFTAPVRYHFVELKTSKVANIGLSGAVLFFFNFL